MKLPADLFATVCIAVREKAKFQDHEVLAIAVDPHHVHMLVELPADRKAVKQIVGTWKQRASHALCDRLPGAVWSKSCDPIVIKDELHQRRVFEYIRRHAEEAAFVWTFRDEVKKSD